MPCFSVAFKVKLILDANALLKKIKWLRDCLKWEKLEVAKFFVNDSIISRMPLSLRLRYEDFVMKDVKRLLQKDERTIAAIMLAGKVSLPWQDRPVSFFNPLRAKFLRENINIYLHFMSFLHTNKTQVAEIPPRVRQGPAYSTLSISWLLMSWLLASPGHQQPWYWPS